MVDLWMPGAQNYSVGNVGDMEGGEPRMTHHITSNDSDWTFTNELGWFSGGGAGVAPHLLVDPFTGQIAQFFPADSRSLSLKNATDSSGNQVRTNRTGKYNIQVEWVFTEGEVVNGKKYMSLKETPMRGLDKVIAWARSLGIKDVWPGGVPTSFSRDTVSLSTWLNEGGHYGHNQVPGNDHLDPGPMPNIFGAVTPPPPTQESDVPFVLNESNAIDVDLTSGTWTPLAFADNGAFMGAASALDISVNLYFDTATPATTKVQGVFYLTNTDNSSPSNYLVIDKRGGGGHQFVHNKPVPTGKKLWFQVRAVSDDGSITKLLHREVSGIYWT